MHRGADPAGTRPGERVRRHALSRALALSLGLLAAAGERAPSAAQAIDTLALESHARFLADDLLEGRGPASRGERLAGLYLATRLDALGLKPLPEAEDYRLPVPLTAVHVDRERTTVRLRDPGGARALHPPDFYHAGGSRSAFRDFEGPLLFAGATPDATAALEGTDVAGAVVILTPPWAGLTEVEDRLLRQGAAGTISLVPDSAFYERLRIVRGPTRYFLPDGVRDPANQSALPGLVGGPAMIRALGLEDRARRGGVVERALPLDLDIAVRFAHETEPRTGYNVAGSLRGTDPALADEWVVYVAHYDHVGFGEPTAGDSLWNGFVDNAVGCAMLLEIARAFAADPPDRSVGFLFVTAEEQGLLGSNWFAHRAPLPTERIHAVINLDGGAPPAPPVEWGLVGADDSEAGRTARRIIEGHDWSVMAVDFGPQSDHWPFHLAGVPTLMLFPGSALEGLGPEEAGALTERWLKPHTPDDEWRPDYPLAGVDRYAELALEIGRALADEVTDGGSGQTRQPGSGELPAGTGTDPAGAPGPRGEPGPQGGPAQLTRVRAAARGAR